MDPRIREGDANSSSPTAVIPGHPILDLLGQTSIGACYTTVNLATLSASHLTP